MIWIITFYLLCLIVILILCYIAPEMDDNGVIITPAKKFKTLLKWKHH
jgi:hypothetical protein